MLIILRYFKTVAKSNILGKGSSGNVKSCFVGRLDFITFSKGAERKNSPINIPGGKKKMKKTKFKSNYSDPSSSKNCHPALISDPITPKAGPLSTKTTNIYGDMPVIRKAAKEENFNGATSTSEDFDSDVMEVDFFSNFNQKLPYSKQEDELILQYVLKGQNIFKVGSISLWKCLESKKDNPKRTYQSLKNRFLRNIKPYLFTTYRHLIKNKETVDIILAKFPELKKQMGVRDTLSKIDLPVRKSPKLLENKEQASRENDEIIERTTSVRALESDDIVDPIIQPNQDWSQSNILNNTNVYRKVNFGKKSIFVSISLTSRNHSEAPRSSPIKISERFKKLRAKKERYFCPACGRYNRHLRENDSSDSDKESDIMIPNSIDEDKKSPKNLRKRDFNSNLNNNQRTRQKIPSEYSSSNLNSQSLLSYDDEIPDPDKPAEDADEDSSKVFGSSKSFTSKKKEIKVENDAKEIQDQEKSQTIISKKEPALGIEKQWDSDSEIDIIYESTMAGFRKLIDADEEKMLFRKCLYKNRDSIGFNSDSEKNLDSYFLDSSQEIDTPTLTENYSTLLQNESGLTEPKSASSSQLASNMIKMLAKQKVRNKES